jgi:glycosyltransferase involved in cell wall biosynthesis
MTAAPLRIVYLSNSVALGGMETHLVDLAVGMAAAGHTVCAVLPELSQLDPVARRLDGGGVETRRIDLIGDSSAARLASNWSRLAAYLRRCRPDVVHQHRTGPYHGKWACLAARAARAPVVVATEHQQAFRLAGPARLANAAADRLLDAVITVSEHDRQTQLMWSGRPPDKIVMIHNGVDLDQFSPPGPDAVAAARARLGIGRTAPVAGTAARLHAQKGLLHLLRCLPALRPAWPDLEILIAGDGPERDRLEQEARSLGVDRQVRFLGFRADVRDVIAATDVCVYPSEWEPLGISAVEAQACAKPVVASRVGGLQEVVADGVTGLLVAPADPAALAAALARILGDPELGRRMGRAGRARAEAMFSRPAMVSQMQALYRRLLAARAAGG